MKIAILTWKYSNYGTLLQSYSLQNFLNEIGYNASLINYDPIKENVIKYDKYNFSKLLKKIKNKLALIKESKEMSNIEDSLKLSMDNREKLFKKFISDNLPLSDNYKIDELKNLNNQFDAFIVGSDQIWSPKFLDSTFFLSFLEDKSRKISYAPSFGVEELDGKVKDIISPWIKSFDYISVREKAGQKIIKELTESIVPVVLDPTLLYNKEKWNEIISSKKIRKVPEKKYILCYFLSNNSYYWEIVKYIENKLDIKVVVIPNKSMDFKNTYDKKIEVDPFDFVHLISNAEYVLTDSFHGTIFAINYNKSFLTLARFSDNKKESENSRLKSILEYLNLKDRFINESEGINCDLYISQEKYEEVECILDKKRQESIEFLTRSLK